jgi:hypothetical protein
MSSAADLLASEVMDRAASLLNDTAKSQYTYAAQLPYLNIAVQELQEEFELNNIPSTQNVSAVIQVAVGVTAITYDAAGTPANPKLPDDMVEPAQLWERVHNIDPFIPMYKRDYLPHYLEGIQSEQFIYFVWESQQIKFLPVVQDNDIKIDYIKQLFNTITDQNTQINIINSKTFLEYRTAALCAEFIERNLTSAQGLNNYAVMGMDRVLGIGSKGKQSIFTRRRPFRAGYKKRGWMT